METKDGSSHFVWILGAPVQDELRYIDTCRTGCAARLTVQTGLHDSLGIQIAIILIRDDFEPAPRTHVFRPKYIVDRADSVALGAGRTGL